MKKIKLLLIVFVVLFATLINVNAKNITPNKESSKLNSYNNNIEKTTNVNKSDYTVIIGYDEKDKNYIFNGLADKDISDIMNQLIQKVYLYISKGDFENIEKMKIANPKLSIILRKNNLFENENKHYSISEIPKDVVTPYSYDTDSFENIKYFRVANDSGLAYADCKATIRVDRDIKSKTVTIVNINVYVIEKMGKFAFNPSYHGNERAEIFWNYLGYDGFGDGEIFLKANYNKTVDMY